MTRPYLTTLGHVRQWLAISGNPVTQISNADPCVVTVANHGRVMGNQIGLDNIIGPVQLNARIFTIGTVINPNQFELLGVDSTTLPTYAGGGSMFVSDPLLQRLISSASAYIQTWLNRVFLDAHYVETRDGQGNPTMVLANGPVISITSLSIDGVNVPPRGPLTPPTGIPSGYTWEDRTLKLTGYRFCRGFSNVAINYRAGYLQADEPHDIPAGLQMVTDRAWFGDRGVTYANGALFVEVPSAPAAGQYALTANGTYLFNAADAGAAILVSYSVVPDDVEQACIEMIGLRFKEMDRIGITGKTIGTETVHFSSADMTASTKTLLQQYRRVSPIL